MARPSQVIVLIEDTRQQQIIRRYLRRVGLESHAMRFRLPTHGSGEQWVREQFPIEVKACRARNTRAETTLIAVIDADRLTIQARLAQLDDRLRDSGVELIHIGEEQVARLIPRRNIETWVLCLNGIEVEEETDYKRSLNKWADLIPPATETLHAWSRPNAQVSDSCIPSLRHGIGELQRLDFSKL